MKWFSQWAIVDCDSYRNFMVVFGHRAGSSLDKLVFTDSSKYGHLMGNVYDGVNE